MPNWCENTLTIIGDQEEIQKFLKTSKSLSNETQYISLERLFPVPPQFEEGRKESSGLTTMSSEEYDWRVKNWGVKWDLSDFNDPEWFLDAWRVSFSSPWCPPLEAICKIAEDFPDLVFDICYSEPGMNFKGRLKIKGEKIEEQWENNL